MSEAAAEKGGDGVAGPRAVWRIVKRPDFGPYFLGNALSASGTWFPNLAASLLIYRLTHSALLLGVLSFSQFIPTTGRRGALRPLPRHPGLVRAQLVVVRDLRRGAHRRPAASPGAREP